MINAKIDMQQCVQNVAVVVRKCNSILNTRDKVLKHCIEHFWTRRKDTSFGRKEDLHFFLDMFLTRKRISSSRTNFNLHLIFLK